MTYDNYKMLIRNLRKAKEKQSMAIPQDQIDEWFTYHAPKGDQTKRYERINEAAKQFAEVVNECAPDSADKTHAMRLIRGARMWSNAAIACNE